MWWKISAVVLLLLVFLFGLLVPLYPGLTHAAPDTVAPGASFVLQIQGYNTFFTRAEAPVRVWLVHEGRHVLASGSVQAVDEVTLEARFEVPATMPVPASSLPLDLVVDDRLHGAMFLPNAVRVQSLSGETVAAADSLWRLAEVRDLHRNEDFRFTHIPINYESIRNLYFHVPMWMVMFVLFLLSMWHSVVHLRTSDAIADARAAGYAEVGLLFGMLGLVTGMLWANYTWGAPWSNDIKQLMTAAALLVYLAYFILRASFDEPEKSARIAAVYNIFAFASLVPLIYIVPRIFSSLHPGGEGNPVFNREDLNVNMRLVFYPAVLGWTLLGLWIARLRIRLSILNEQLMDR